MLNKLTQVFTLTICAVLMTGCGGGDDMPPIDAGFEQITMGMSMTDVNALVGEPDSTGPLEDSDGGKVSVWGENTRVFYDKNSAVTAVIHHGSVLELESE